jgi:hypothetical protein
VNDRSGDQPAGQRHAEDQDQSSENVARFLRQRQLPEFVNFHESSR